MQGNNHTDYLAKKLWDYGLMHQPLQKADAIIVFGSYNPIVGAHAAKLWQDDWAPLVVFSGNRSDSTSGWQKTEAETMAEVAMANGLPEQHVLLETKATNSGQNTIFSKELLANHGIHPTRIIAVQKPYAERRAYATIRKQWPEVDVIVSSPDISYEEYMETSPKGRDGSIQTICGDLQRIKLYAEQGFQISQQIPTDVWQAYGELVKLGYGESLATEN